MNDVIERQAAIDALENDKASLDHIIRGMSANDVRLDAYVSQRNQVNYDIDTINNLPTAQPEQLGTNLAEVGTDTISRQAACEYCHEDSEGYVRPLEKNCHAFIRFGMDGWELSLQAKGWHGSAKIKYCPICGRRLTDG